MSLETKESVWVLCDTGAEYQPYSFFNNSSWLNSQNTDIPQIKNYKHWLSVFNDNFGFYVDVFYPENAKEGKSIKILVFHPKGIYPISKRKFDSIAWICGKDGLFATRILPVLRKY